MLVPHILSPETKIPNMLSSTGVSFPRKTVDGMEKLTLMYKHKSKRSSKVNEVSKGEIMMKIDKSNDPIVDMMVQNSRVYGYCKKILAGKTIDESLQKIRVFYVDML